jgi:transposase-like protein
VLQGGCMRRERPALFNGRHFEAEIVVVCVGWYLPYRVSFRQLEHGRAGPES